MLSDYILALLKVAKEENAEVTAIKFQKIFFLLEKEKGVNLGIEFEPYLFGPYSEKLQNILYELAKQGFVKINYEPVNNLAGVTVGYKESYEIAKEVEVSVSDDVLEFFREWAKKSRNKIQEYVYKKYPEYSDIKTHRKGT